MVDKISIITATFNAESTLKYCLESVNKQTLDAEHIIIDGESDDGTEEILAQYKDRLACIVSEPDMGIYDAMNKGIAQSTGDVIGILNADDFYPSLDILSMVMDVFKNPTVEACYGNLKYVDTFDTNKIVRNWQAGNYNKKKFYWGWMPPHPTFFVRRTVYERFGTFDQALGSAADYEIMLRLLLKRGIHTVYIPETMVHMRTGGVSNASIFNRLKANRMDRKAWEINGLKPYPWTLWAKPLRKIGQWVIK